MISNQPPPARQTNRQSNRQPSKQSKRGLFKSIRAILPESKRTVFGSLDVYPKDVSFATQNKNEKVFIKIRSHTVVNIGWLLRGLLYAAAPFLIILVLDVFRVVMGEFLGFDDVVALLDQFLSSIFSVPITLVISFGLFYYSVIISTFYINFINWYFNIYLVTNERMMHIELKAFTGKRIAEARLDKIEDISQKAIGFLPTIFHYGDVRVQTAAQKNRFHFEEIPDPTWFRDVLSDLSKLVKISEP